MFFILYMANKLFRQQGNEFPTLMGSHKVFFLFCTLFSHFNALRLFQGSFSHT